MSLCLRVIAGTYKGLKLLGPTHQGLRPTTDMVREALFNILRDDVFDGRVLDLFAGSGSLGIEALSRGAGFVTFVEQDSKSLRLLKQNLERLRAEKLNVRVLPSDVFRIMPRLSREEEKYDLILVDPPYKAELWCRVLSDIDHYQLLRKDGRIVIELPKYRRLPDKVGDLIRKDKKDYGEVSLEFWGYQESGVDGDDHSHLPGEL